MEVPPVGTVYQLAVPEQPVTDKETVPGPQRLAFTAVGAGGSGVTVTVETAVPVQPDAVPVTVYEVVVAGVTLIELPLPPVLQA
jgi:hypothetical protein